MRIVRLFNVNFESQESMTPHKHCEHLSGSSPSSASKSSFPQQMASSFVYDVIAQHSSPCFMARTPLW